MYVFLMVSGPAVSFRIMAPYAPGPSWSDLDRSGRKGGGQTTLSLVRKDLVRAGTRIGMAVDCR